ncbi:hypothetical protein D3C80_1345660 [compost metagenome]
MLAIQDHAAGPFQIHTLLFQGAQIDGLTDGKTLFEHLEHALAALQAAVLAFHRVEHQAAVGVAAPPVVGENRVRGVRRRGVLHHQHFDAVLAQGVDITIELFQRFLLCLLRLEQGLLETVVEGGIRVEGEPRRADHQDCICCLHRGTHPGLAVWLLSMRRGINPG